MKTASWGLRDLDRAVGVHVPGRLIVIGARPSNGKTTFLFGWLNALYATIYTEPWKILCFWTERAPELSYLTWACLRLGLPLDAVVKQQWSYLPEGAEGAIDADVRRLSYHATVAQGEWIAFADQERPTVADLTAAVEQWRPEILVLDYLQRIKPVGRQTKFEAIGEAATVLQQLAVRKKMIVVVGSQLKRRGDGAFDKYRPPHLEDFKLSGEIEENADIAIGLFRPLRRMSAKEEARVRTGESDLSEWQIPNTMAVKVLKHRYWGDAADRIVKVHCEHGRITDAADFRAPPLQAGDAYEAAEETIPF